MKTFESGWQNNQGLKFYVRGWEPEAKLRAVVALVHGLGEHVARYAPIAEIFTAARYALAGFDLRGHGRSGGPRGHTPSYDKLMDDIADFLALVRGRYPRRPLFLYGHSLGGNLVLNYCLRRLGPAGGTGKSQLGGVIVTAPWLKSAFELPAWRVSLGRVMNVVAPGFTQKSGLETLAISHDEELVQAYDRDPLVHDRISARFFIQTRQAGLWASEHAADFPLPLLLMHGTADRLTAAQASREFATRAGKKVTWRAWEGLYHEIHNEPQRPQVAKVMINWMNGRLSH